MNKVKEVHQCECAAPTHELRIYGELVKRCPECGRVYRQFEPGRWETNEQVIRRILYLLDGLYTKGD